MNWGAGVELLGRRLGILCHSVSLLAFRMFRNHFDGTKAPGGKIRSVWQLRTFWTFRGAQLE